MRLPMGRRLLGGIDVDSAGVQLLQDQALPSDHLADSEKYRSRRSFESG
jgi:hypothetical protein